MNKTIRIVQGGFAAIFGLTIISVIIRGIKENIPIWAEILLIFVSLVSIGGLVILYQKLKAKKLTEKQSDRIFFIIAGLMLIIQIIFAVILCYKPWYDLGFVDKAARDFCLTWDKKDLYTHLPERHENYFVRYTNNQAILIILSVIYSVCNTVLGKMPYLVPVMINTFGLNISVILMYFTAKKIFRNPTTALFTGILASIFSVFYTYTPFYYTDSLSMPFVMSSVLLFLRGIDSKRKLYSAIQLIMSGFLVFIGYKIKGSVIILIPAFLIYFIVFTKKFNILKHICQFSLFLAGCVIMSVLSGIVIGSFNIAEKEELEEIQFPPTHWIMMGLHGRGNYNSDDFWFTVNSGNYEQKKKANIEEIKKRVSDYGLYGNIEHLAVKLSWTWWDGTYMIGYYIKKGSDSMLRNFICHSKTFKIYCTVFHVSLLFSIIYSFIRGAFSKRINREILLKIIFCGIYFFLVIWESRSRYLVNFTPFFLMIFAGTIRDISNFYSVRFLKNRYVRIRK